MANFTFDSTVPATNNNPSNDQPVMQTNNVSEEGIWEEDHVGFNADNGGTHLQCTFFTNNTPSGLSGSKLIAYTKQGLATTNSDLAVLNDSGTFPVSIIRAAGKFTLDRSASQAMTQYLNCSPTVTCSGITYTITLTSGVTTGNDVLVLMTTSSNTTSASWSYTNPTLTITSTANTSIFLSFIVIQI